jgi:hypothetical protein
MERGGPERLHGCLELARVDGAWGGVCVYVCVCVCVCVDGMTTMPASMRGKGNEGKKIKRRAGLAKVCTSPVSVEEVESLL